MRVLLSSIRLEKRLSRGVLFAKCHAAQFFQQPLLRVDMPNNFEEFINCEVAYLAWVKANKSGYVLNVESRPRAAYMPLHSASCWTISKRSKNAHSDAFTGQGYIKICSNDPNALLTWMARYGVRHFPQICSKCKPDISSIDQAAYMQAKLQEEASRLMKNPEKLQPPLEIPREPPSYYYVQTKVFNRSPVVVAATLLRANGICEKCSIPAPFLRAVTNTPYLEVHHKQRLADGGIDHPENTLALCPNCHREAHFG